MEKLSTCCGAECYNEDSDFCPECHDHATFLCDDCFENDVVIVGHICDCEEVTYSGKDAEVDRAFDKAEASNAS